MTGTTGSPATTFLIGPKACAYVCMRPPQSESQLGMCSPDGATCHGTIEERVQLVTMWFDSQIDT
eukprot:6213416-Amphidinium_carterae.1